MISIKRANEASTQPLLFISITRSSGLEVVICRNATLKFLEPKNIYSPMLISGLESHIPDFSLLGLLHFSLSETCPIMNWNSCPQKLSIKCISLKNCK